MAERGGDLYVQVKTPHAERRKPTLSGTIEVTTPSEWDDFLHDAFLAQKPVTITLGGVEGLAYVQSRAARFDHHVIGTKRILVTYELRDAHL